MFVSVHHLLLLEGFKSSLSIANELVELSHVFYHRLLRFLVINGLLAECTEADLILSVVEGRDVGRSLRLQNTINALRVFAILSVFAIFSILAIFAVFDFFSSG